jgi:hypothetical protein
MTLFRSFQAGAEERHFRSPKKALSGHRRGVTFPLTEKRSYKEQRKSDFSAPRKFAI